MLALADVKERHMKKLALGVAVALVGCTSQRNPETEYPGGSIQVIKFEGHEYLSFDGNHYDGGVVHSESCPCKSK
jgi:hypothetical protein